MLEKDSEISSRHMGEKHLFFDHLKLTSQVCGSLIEKQKKDQFEEHFQDMLAKLHDEPYFSESSKLTMMGVQVLDITTEEKNKMNKLFFRAEIGIHQGDRRLTENCLRCNLDWQTAFDIFESVDPGLLSKIIPKSLEKRMDNLTRTKLGSWLLYILQKFAKMTFIYADLIRDFMLLYTLVTLISVQSWLNFSFFAEFSHQILWLLLFSIVVPLMATAVSVGYNNPGVLFGYGVSIARRSNILVSLPLSVIFCPILPALLTNVLDIENQKTRELLKKGHNLPWTLEEAFQRIQFSRKVEKQVLFFKELELVVEVSIQSTIQLTMILVNQTNTRTARGLDSAFEESIKFGFSNTIFILIVSILLTLTTALSTYVSLNKSYKHGFLPMKAKLILALRGFIVKSSKIISFVLFFSSYLGLFSLLGHHEQEKITFQIPKGKNKTSVLNSISSLNTQYLLSEVFRFTDNPSSPSPTDYTVFSLMTSFIMFLVILFIQFVIIYICKLKSSITFKKDKLSNKLWHICRCLLIPDVFTDWDENLADTLEVLTEKFKQTLVEISVDSIIHLIFNIIKLVPLIVTGSNIIQRHHLLKDTIGTKPIEEHSYFMAYLFICLPIPLVSFLSFVEWYLMMAFQHYFHPWKNILITNLEQKAGGMKIIHKGEKLQDTIEHSMVSFALISYLYLYEFSNVLGEQQQENDICQDPYKEEHYSHRVEKALYILDESRETREIDCPVFKLGTFKH